MYFKASHLLFQYSQHLLLKWGGCGLIIVAIMIVMMFLEMIKNLQLFQTKVVGKIQHLKLQIVWLTSYDHY